MGASTNQGMDIATKSREIIRELIKDDVKGLNPLETDIVERIVHSTADPEYAKLVVMSEDFTRESIKALKNQEDILTDINMVKSGITQYEGDVKCYIKDPEVKKLTQELSKTQEITRAASAIQYAANEGFEGIIIVGNAPTALLKAIELKEKGELNVKSIIGVPVGFVAAADSKEELRQTDIPNIITTGPKGGTPIAVATINSLIQNCKD